MAGLAEDFLFPHGGLDSGSYPESLVPTLGGVRQIGACLVVQKGGGYYMRTAGGYRPIQKEPCCGGRVSIYGTCVECHHARDQLWQFAPVFIGPDERFPLVG